MSNKQIFISFSSKNQDEANRVCNLLEDNGYSCFISSRDLVAGKEYAGQLIDNIASTKALVLLLSQDSNDSPHVLREIEYAVSKKIPILVYALEQVKLSKSMEYYLMTHQWIPADSNRDERLIEGVKNLLNGPSSTTVNNTDYSTNRFKQPQDYVLNEVVEKKNNNTKIVIAVVAAFIIVAIAIRIIALSLFTDKKQTGGSSNDNIAEATTTPDEITEATPTITTEVTSEPTATKEPIVTEEPVASPTPYVEVDYKLGDTITFGTYNDTAIDWRVIKINGDGTIVMIAKDILSMKIFDAAEGGEYNYYEGINYFQFAYHIIDDPMTCVMARGNNDWSISTLRTWLNSDKEVVKYKDQAPTKKAYIYNHYDAEPGFLHGFTDAEKAALVTVTNKTNGNELSTNGFSKTVESNDLVYLLSSDELALLEEADISHYAFPNKACIEKDNNPEGFIYIKNNYDVNSYNWWLRDNPGTYPNRVYVVANEVETESKILDGTAGGSTYGVRPVVTVDVSKLGK